MQISLLTRRFGRSSYAVELGVTGFGGTSLSAPFIEGTLYFVFYDVSYFLVNQCVKPVDNKLQYFLHAAGNFQIKSLVNVLKVFFNCSISSILFKKRVIQTQSYRIPDLFLISFLEVFLLLSIRCHFKVVECTNYLLFLIS